MGQGVFLTKTFPTYFIPPFFHSLLSDFVQTGNPDIIHVKKKIYKDWEWIQAEIRLKWNTSSLDKQFFMKYLPCEIWEEQCL